MVMMYKDFVTSSLNFPMLQNFAILETSQKLDDKFMCAVILILYDTVSEDFLK